MSQGKTVGAKDGGASRKEPALWVARVSRAIRVPLWLGVLILGLIPFPVMLVIGAKLANVPPAQVSGYIVPFIPLTFPLVLLPIISSVYISQTIHRVSAYADTLLPRRSNSSLQPTVNFSSLYTVRFVVPLACALLIAIDLLYYVSGSVPLALYPVVVPAFLYSYFAISYTIWAYAYAIYSIWRIGRLPLELKHFTEDRMLGLRPFGTASLKLTLAYVLTAFAGCLAAWGFPLLVKLVLFTAFTIPGVGFFLLPLFGLHRKLASAKNSAMEWISKEHGVILREMERPGGLADGALATRLATVRSVREDVKMIREWPFDSETIVRLVTLIVLPLLIALGAPFVLHYL
jgi:hypothetical protein